MKNCLVVGLNAEVDNPNLEVFHEIRFKIGTNMESSSFFRVPVRSKVKALSGAFKVTQDGESLTEYTFPDSTSGTHCTIYSNGSESVISVISDYDVNYNAAFCEGCTILSDPAKIFARRVINLNTNGCACDYMLNLAGLDFSHIIYNVRFDGSDWVEGDIVTIADGGASSVQLNGLVTGTIESFAARFISKHPGLAKNITFKPYNNTSVTYNGQPIANGTLAITEQGTYSYS